MELVIRGLAGCHECYPLIVELHCQRIRCRWRVPPRGALVFKQHLRRVTGVKLRSDYRSLWLKIIGTSYEKGGFHPC
jgi:hypothetical protein